MKIYIIKMIERSSGCIDKDDGVVICPTKEDKDKYIKYNLEHSPKSFKDDYSYCGTVTEMDISNEKYFNLRRNLNTMNITNIKYIWTDDASKYL
jgi:hypothetical protein